MQAVQWNIRQLGWLYFRILTGGAQAAARGHYLDRDQGIARGEVANAVGRAAVVRGLLVPFVLLCVAETVLARAWCLVPLMTLLFPPRLPFSLPLVFSWPRGDTPLVTPFAVAEAVLLGWESRAVDAPLAFSGVTYRVSAALGEPAGAEAAGRRPTPLWRCGTGCPWYPMRTDGCTCERIVVVEAARVSE